MLVLFLAPLIADEKRSQTETMPQERKLDCPICSHPRLTNLSDDMNKRHSLNVKEGRYWLEKARFSALSRQPEHPQPSIPQSDSTPGQCS